MTVKTRTLRLFCLLIGCLNTGVMASALFGAVRCHAMGDDAATVVLAVAAGFNAYGAQLMFSAAGRLAMIEKSEKEAAERAERMARWNGSQ